MALGLRYGAIIVASLGMVCTTFAHDASAAHDASPVPVESEARAAFARAMARYPQSIRDHLAHVELHRDHSYGMPEEAPLMARLMGDAAYAYYSMNHDAVVLLDAGFAEQGRWTGGDVEEADVAGLMLDLGLLDEGADPHAAWDRFVEIVQGWPGDAPIDPPIRFADERVLDRFVRLGVGRSLAKHGESVGALDIEQQMVHELAHALQLDGPLMTASARMEAWGTLSGWVRADRNEPFNGFHGGMVRMEHPAVLGRLLVSDERGEGLYAHAPEARFVNRYARYDAREDYAESVRLFLEDPQRLIRIDPVKFMFINALGYNAALDLAEPGPLWIDAAEIEVRGWREQVQRGARELLTGREGIQADARTVAGLLRAHAELLNAQGLPECDVFLGPPPDAPDSIAQGLDPEHFSAEIDGRRFGPDAHAVENLLVGAIINRYEDDVFWRSMNDLMDADAESLEEEFADLAKMHDPQDRAMAAARLFSNVNDTIEDNRLSEMIVREVRAMRTARRPMLAETLKLRFALSQDQAVPSESIGRWVAMATEESGSYGAAELRRALVDLLLRDGQQDRAMEIAKSMRGESWGLLRKVDAMCAIAASTGDASVLRAAEGELAGQPETDLINYLALMTKGTRESIASQQENGK